MPAVPGWEQYLPAKCAPAVKNALVYNLPSPRVGFSYQLSEKQKTQVRASYAMLASLLKTQSVRMVSGAVYSSVYYLAIDMNHDGVAQPGSPPLPVPSGEFVQMLGYYGFDPANPSDASKSVNRIDPNIKTPFAHEIVAGFDHELMPQFSLSASFPYRRFTNLDWTPLIGVRADDYVQKTPVTGTLFGESYSVPNYYLPNSLLPPGMGKELVTRDGYHRSYMGLELSATKRLSNHWMARLGFSTNSLKEYFENPATSLGDPTPDPASPNMNGGQVVFATQSAQKASMMNYVVQPKYQFIANGLYQAPWDVQFSGNFLVRQGYAIPYFYGNVAGPTGYYPSLKNVLITTAVDQYRLPTVALVDFRVQKTVRLPHHVNAVLSLDVFNVLNSATVLGRQPDQSLTGVTGFNSVQQIMSPRVLRLGARITF
jgi:hypothetical protein